MNFLDWFAKLAPQGETALIVRQKPKLADGEIQQHADGTLKCTWPAFLASRGTAPGQAWYGNTGSFIIERFDEGRVSASAANCEYALVLVLDDVGTKSKAPPLAPTWRMETSPGNEQWGYAFREQPTKAEFTAAMRAIADAGFTDPGALNAVRNFRLPGSINLKPGKANWASVLVEFDPTREFTLPEICTALGVVPAEPSAPLRPLRLADDNADDVMIWLSEHGYLLSQTNAEGWCGVVCPNHAEHSDGSVEGRYMPATRSFCCWHGHCEDWRSTAFLTWVADAGGPRHATGLRDTLLAERMAMTLKQITPTEAFPDAAQKVIEEVNARELGRLEQSDWAARFAYVEVDDSYFDILERREVSRRTFNALFRHIDCRSIHGKRPRVEASVSFDENRQARGARSIAGVTYAAGETELVARNGLVYGNRWRNARPEVAPGGAPLPWLAHVETLIPNVDERNHVLDVMAYKVQHPEVKINHAILHGGLQGCGKDTLYAPFIWAVCGPGNANKGLLDNDTISSSWGYALESEILILNELKEPEARERRALANRLKPIIAAPPELLSVNRKNLHPYDMLNRMLVLAYTNDPMPISLDTQDRRWFCLWSHAPRMDGDALWTWYRSGGFEECASWLYARDVSAFNPAAAPPVTDWKLNLVEHSMSAQESTLVDMIRARAGVFRAGVIGSPWQAIAETLSAQSSVRFHQAHVLHALAEAGWRDCGRVKAAGANAKHVFCAPEFWGLSASELRRLAESPVTLSIVKSGQK